LDAQEFTEISDVEAFFAEMKAWTSAGNFSCVSFDFFSSNRVINPDIKELDHVVFVPVRPTLKEE
jgi:hypothetical protein